MGVVEFDFNRGALLTGDGGVCRCLLPDPLDGVVLISIRFSGNTTGPTP